MTPVPSLLRTSPEFASNRIRKPDPARPNQSRTRPEQSQFWNFEIFKLSRFWNFKIQYVTILNPFWAYFEHLCETILGPISDNNPEIIKILTIHIFNLENPENLNSAF